MARFGHSTRSKTYFLRMSFTDLSTQAGVTQTGVSLVRAEAEAVPLWNGRPHGSTVTLHG